MDRLVVAKHSKTEVFLDSDQLEDLDLIFASGLVLMWVVHHQEFSRELGKTRAFNNSTFNFH